MEKDIILNVMMATLMTETDAQDHAELKTLTLVEVALPLQLTTVLSTILLELLST